MKLELLDTEKAVGKLISHDITRIEKGKFKGAAFKKGHRIKAEDVDALLNLGKKHVYILELEPDELHEDDAGERIAGALVGPGLELSGPSEGRLDLKAAHPGLLKIDVARLHRINCISDVVVSSLHNNTPIETGETAAGAKVIPLAVKEETVTAVEQICTEGPPPFAVRPYLNFKVGGVITGQEVLEGRIQDGFAPVLAEKAARFGLEKPSISYSSDDKEVIISAIEEHLHNGCTMIVITGGMSVDPDDVTPAAIKQSGAEIVKYGAPALPGAMFLLAYKNEVPIIGLPACAMYYRNTVMDILLPRLVAGEKIAAGDIAALGHGGLCRRCDPCAFPRCSFGKSGL